MSSESQTEGVYVSEGCRRGKKCMCLCYLFCFDLSRYYLLLPAVKCAAVMAPRETRRQAGGVFLLSEDCYEFSSLCCRCTRRSLCKQEKEGGREGGRTRKTKRKDEKERQERKVSEKERENAKDEESCHHKESDSFPLFWI